MTLFTFITKYIALVCTISGSYFCYDTPGSLQDHIKEDMGVDTVKFASLYSLYSWPNVVLCFVGGFLIDRWVTVKWSFYIIISKRKLLYTIMYSTYDEMAILKHIPNINESVYYYSPHFLIIIIIILMI